MRKPFMVFMFAVFCCVGSIGCESRDDAASLQRSLGSVSTCMDRRTGLCFNYVWRRGSYRTGVTNVPCESITESLRRTHRRDGLVCDGMRYVRVDQPSDPSLCYGYLLDEGGNQKSNLAHVPCEPVLSADEAGRVRLDLYRP